MFSVTVEKKFADMFACDGREGGSGGEPFYKVEEKTEIGSIGDNGIVGKPSFSNEIVKEDVQVLGKGVASQGFYSGKINKIKNKGPVVVNDRPFGLHSASHSVELAKFPQSFSAFSAFFNTRFFIVFAPFEFTFDSVNLQFLFQLADRVLNIASDFYFDHNKITSFGL